MIQMLNLTRCIADLIPGLQRAKSITTLYSLTDKLTLKNLQALQAKFLQISSATLLLWPNYKKHMHYDDSVINEMLRVTYSL